MKAAPRFEALFDPAFLGELESFSLRIADAQKGGRLAEQRTAARGQGSDFADFKPYVAGDDLRAIDWNIYRRLGRAFVRVFEERQDLPVYLLPDVSSSMFVEELPRIDAALRVALALAAVALRQHDAVSVLPFAGSVTTSVRAASGRGNLARIAHALADVTPMGAGALPDVLAQVAGMKVRRGLAVILSDFFDPAGIAAVVDAMERLPHRLLLVQITRDYDADPDLMPDLAGDVMVDDGEGSPMPLTVTPDLAARYRASYRDFSDRLGGFARQRGVGLARIDAATPVLPQLVTLFRGGMVL